METRRPSVRKAIAVHIALILTVCLTLMVALVGTGLYLLGSQRAQMTLELRLTDAVRKVAATLATSLEQAAEGWSMGYRHLGGTSYASEEASAELSYVVSGLTLTFVDGDGVAIASSDADLAGIDLTGMRQFSTALEAVLDEGAEAYVPEIDLLGKDLQAVLDQCVACVRLDARERVCLVTSLGKWDLLSRLDDALEDHCQSVGIGESGYYLVCDVEGRVMSSGHADQIGKVLEPLRAGYAGIDASETYEWDVFGDEAYVRVAVVCGRALVGVYPKSEVQDGFWATMARMLPAAVATLLVLEVLLGRLLKRSLLDNLARTNASLARITDGDLDERVDVRTFEEFATLSDGINETVVKLEELAEKEARRIDEELAAAYTIQRSSLPSVFPPYPNRHDFGLFASMDVARGVGGDFYDFFMLSDTELAFLVADVSDKGFGAALYMMRAKTAIKGHVVSGLPIDEAMMRANAELCADNEAGMFVTVWLGVLDTETGAVTYVHAGHTCPVLVRSSGAVVVRQRREFFMGAMPTVGYTRQALQLHPEDMLIVYSDGVTEAFDTQGAKYGERRLCDLTARVAREEVAACEDVNERCKAVCAAIRADVAAFAQGESQSDDITLLCVTYRGGKETS